MSGMAGYCFLLDEATVQYTEVRKTKDLFGRLILPFEQRRKSGFTIDNGNHCQPCLPLGYQKAALLHPEFPLGNVWILNHSVMYEGWGELAIFRFPWLFRGNPVDPARNARVLHQYLRDDAHIILRWPHVSDVARKRYWLWSTAL